MSDEPTTEAATATTGDADETKGSEAERQPTRPGPLLPEKERPCTKELAERFGMGADGRPLTQRPDEVDPPKLIDRTPEAEADPE